MARQFLNCCYNCLAASKRPPNSGKNKYELTYFHILESFLAGVVVVVLELFSLPSNHKAYVSVIP
jgi:hypothetical protein